MPNVDDANREAMEGLPENEAKETQTILDEIAKDEEAKTAADKAAAEADKPEVKPDADAEAKAAAEKKRVEDEATAKAKAEEQKRDLKLMPAYIHNSEKSRWERREKDLLQQIEDAQKRTAPSKDEKDDKKIDNLSDKELDTIAEEMGVPVEAAKKLLDLAAKRNAKLPPEIQKSLDTIEKHRADAEAAAELTHFTNDFGSSIVPLIKAEYGPDVAQTVIDKVKDEIAAKAYDPKFKDVPLAILYRGDESFRGLVTTKKSKGAEDTRGGSSHKEAGNDEDQTDLSKPLTDAQIIGLSDKDFDTYQANMEKYEKGKK